MGVEQSADFNPALENWEKVNSVFGVSTWVNRVTKEEIQEYSVLYGSEQEFSYEIDAFRFRINSPVLVASKYLKREKKSELCVSLYSASLFLEKIHVRLKKINEIPYPDILHLYYQAFRGFDLLKGQVRPFAVTEDMIGFNNKGVAKVWMHSNYSKTLAEFPDTLSEQEMLSKIIEIIDVNTYQESMPSSIASFFRGKNLRSFRDASVALRQYASQYGTEIPQRMECILEKDFDLATENEDRGVVTFGGNQIIYRGQVPVPTPIISYETIQSRNVYQPQTVSAHYQHQPVIVPRHHIHAAQVKSNLNILHPSKSSLFINQPIRPEVVHHNISIPSILQSANRYSHNLQATKSLSRHRTIENLGNPQILASRLRALPHRPEQVVLQKRPHNQLTHSPRSPNRSPIRRSPSPKIIRSGSPPLFIHERLNPRPFNQNIVRVVSPKSGSSILNLKQLKNKAKAEFRPSQQGDQLTRAPRIQKAPSHATPNNDTRLVRNMLQTPNSLEKQYRNQPNNYNKGSLRDNVGESVSKSNRHLTPSSATQYTNIVKKVEQHSINSIEESRYQVSTLINLTPLQTSFKQGFTQRQTQMQADTPEYDTPIKKEYGEDTRMQSFSFKNLQYFPEIKNQSPTPNIAGSGYISSMYVPLSVRSKTEAHPPLYDIESLNKTLQIQKHQIQKKFQQFHQKYDYEFVRGEVQRPPPPINLSFPLHQFSHYPTVRSRDQYEVTSSKSTYYPSMDPQLLKDLQKIRANLPLNR